MRVGIDISQIAFPGTGTAHYTRDLVDGLLKVDRKNNYVLFGGSLRQRSAFRQFPQANIFPIPPTVLELLWNKFHVFPVENLIGNIDVFHSSDWTQPPTKAKKVTTIHDLVVYKYPEASHPKIVATQKRRLKRVKEECDLVIAVSEATKRDIIDVLQIPEKRIRVVYEATNIKPPKNKYRLGKPYILSVGTREPRKNLDRLIEAYQKLGRKNIDLVVAGKYGWGEEKIRGVRVLGYVPQEKLAELYNGAEVFVYPSLYEGFGLPVLEAMTCGCPVVTSSVSSLPEVGGKAALYIDPSRVDDIVGKVNQILTMSPGGREKLIRLGKDQARKFSWEKAAKETVAVYEEAARD